MILYFLGFLFLLLGMLVMSFDAESKGISEEATKLVGLFLAVIGFIFIVSHTITENIQKDYFKKPIENKISTDNF